MPMTLVEAYREANLPNDALPTPRQLEAQEIIWKELQSLKRKYRPNGISREEWEDVVEEQFLYLVEGTTTEESRLEPKTDEAVRMSLVVFLRYRALDVIRRRKSLDPIDLDHGGEALSRLDAIVAKDSLGGRRTRSTPEQNRQRVEAAKAAARLLRTLPPQQSRAAAIQILATLEMTEVATELRLPSLGTKDAREKRQRIRNQFDQNLKRAREAIAAKLAEDGPGATIPVELRSYANQFLAAVLFGRAAPGATGSDRPTRPRSSSGKTRTRKGDRS